MESIDLDNGKKRAALLEIQEALERLQWLLAQHDRGRDVSHQSAHYALGRILKTKRALEPTACLDELEWLAMAQGAAIRGTAELTGWGGTPCGRRHTTPTPVENFGEGRVKSPGPANGNR